MKDLRLILIGCAIGTVCSTTTAWLVTSRPVEAQAQGPFTRCFVARQESVDTGNDGNVESPSIANMINVPTGWVPVGGGALSPNWTSSVVLCRR